MTKDFTYKQKFVMSLINRQEELVEIVEVLCPKTGILRVRYQGSDGGFEYELFSREWRFLTETEQVLYGQQTDF